jgi:hypothetical protein
MSARSFGSLFMVASCAGAALGCYLVSLRVASERAALEDVETFGREAREPFAIQVQLAAEGDPGANRLGLLKRDFRADVDGVGVVIPNPAVQKILTGTVAWAAQQAFPIGAVVGADAHGID